MKQGSLPGNFPIIHTMHMIITVMYLYMHTYYVVFSTAKWCKSHVTCQLCKLSFLSTHDMARQSFAQGRHFQPNWVYQHAVIPPVPEPSRFLYALQDTEWNGQCYVSGSDPLLATCFVNLIVLNKEVWVSNASGRHSLFLCSLRCPS